MRHITVRGVPPELATALEKEKRRRGTSLNQTVLELLNIALGLSAEPMDNGLGRFAGTWSKEEFEEFEENTRDLEKIDPDLWS